jgi:hypothetical protein
MSINDENGKYHQMHMLQLTVVFDGLVEFIRAMSLAARPAPLSPDLVEMMIELADKITSQMAMAGTPSDHYSGLRDIGANLVEENNARIERGEDAMSLCEELLVSKGVDSADLFPVTVTNTRQ